MADDPIYRVSVRTTGSLQPGRASTFSVLKVLYCGTSLADARLAYLVSSSSDWDGSYGGPVRETVIEQFVAVFEDTGDEPIKAD